jgi:hypothetical protein
MDYFKRKELIYRTMRIGACATAVILVGGETSDFYSHSLVPREHNHNESRTEPIASAASDLSASGGLVTRTTMWAHEGEDTYAASRRPVKVEVESSQLPSGETAYFLNTVARHNPECWKIVRVKDGMYRTLNGKYASLFTAKIALAYNLKAESVPNLNPSLLEIWI